MDIPKSIASVKNAKDSFLVLLTVMGMLLLVWDWSRTNAYQERREFEHQQQIDERFMSVMEKAAEANERIAEAMERIARGETSKE